MIRKKIAWQWLSAAIMSLMMFSTPALAGDLNPSAPTGPTMKTLNEIPAKDEVMPPWSQILPASERFKLVMGGAAVLDRETGLVWERVPDSTLYSWVEARGHCFRREIAGRFGWRLPTIEELSSLLDKMVSVPPYLPIGHPFYFELNPNMEFNRYWSTNTSTDITTSGSVVNFGTGNMFALPKSDTYKAWCVRGGYGHDGGHN